MNSHMEQEKTLKFYPDSDIKVMNFLKDALELMFYYAIKVPSKMPAVIYTLKEKFSFTRLGYMYGDRIQHILFDFLIENAQIQYQ